MNTLFPPGRRRSLFSSFAIDRLALSAFLIGCCSVGPISDAQAQFTFAADSAANYGGAGEPSWANGSSAGTGFGAWSFTSGGNAGGFIGNPSSGGISGMNAESFGLFANPTNAGNFIDVDRSLSTAMQVGDSFSFQWGVNFDADGPGSKGFNLNVGTNQLINLNIGGSSTITINGTNTGFGYGTTAMTWSFFMSSATNLVVTANGRDGSGTYSNNFAITGGISSLRLYASQLNNSSFADQRQPYYNNFLSTNSGVFSMGGTVTNANTFTGSGNLSVGDNTTLVLSGGGNNNYSGTTTVSNGSTLRFTGSGNSGFVSAISGGGLLSKGGTGTLTLSGNNSSFTGKTTVTTGALSIDSDARLGAAPGTATADQLTLSGGALATTASFALAANRGITLSTGTVGVMRVASGTGLTNNAVVTGSGNLAKEGTGTLALIAANTHSGQTRLREGVLLVGNNAAFGTGEIQISFLGDFGNKTLAAEGASARTITNTLLIFNDLNLGQTSVNTGSLTFSGVTELGNEAGTRNLLTASGTSHTLSGEVRGLRGIVKQGGGTLTLSGNNSYGTTFQLNEGTVLVGNNNAFGNGVLQVQFGVAGTKTIASSSTEGYTIGNNVNVFNDLNLGLASGGTGSINFGGTFFLGDEVGQNRVITAASGTGHTVSGAVTGLRGIVKQGTGTLTLSGVNTSTGGLFVDDGTLQIDGGSLAFGQIDIGSGVAGDQSPNSATLRLSSGTISQGITVNSEGTAGARSIEFANSTGSATLSGTVTLEKTVTADVANSAATGVLSGVVSGTGGITKSGNGTLTLSGASANTYTGLTTVSAGTLNLNKSNGNAITGATTIGSGAVLLLSASNQVDSGAGDLVTLSGGTIRRGASVSEAFGNLNVTSNSFLDFGTGAVAEGYGMRFETYTSSALLAVQNFLPGNKLQFASGFNSALLPTGGSLSNANFSFSNDFTTGTEDDYFTITAIPEPSTYLAAAGLLALFAASARRRIKRDRGA